MTNKKLRNDIFLVVGIGLLLLTVCIVLKVTLNDNNYNNNDKPGFVKVIVDKKVKHCYNFNKNGEYTITSGKNTNVLVIKDGTAFIKSADCPDKICVHHSPISKVGETIICLPHKLVVEIVKE